MLKAIGLRVGFGPIGCSEIIEQDLCFYSKSGEALTESKVADSYVTLQDICHYAHQLVRYPPGFLT